MIDISSKTTETLWGLGIAVVSFIAGQFWSLAATLYRERKLRKALLREVSEMPPWILRNVKSLECLIQLSCLNELANYGPVLIPMQVHAEHFPEINLKLSTAERTSFNAIYNLVHRLNEDCGKIHELMRKCATDVKNFHEMRLVLDATYRNSYHALLLIKLHQDYVHKLEEITATDKAIEIVFEMRAKNDSDLLKLAAEAKKDGAAKIRAKYQDGAVSVEDVARTAPPVPGNFYFDPTGAKFKCLEIRDGVVIWLQLETQIGGLTLDAVLLQPMDSVRHVYEITDADEKTRLQRRYDDVKSRIQIPPK